MAMCLGVLIFKPVYFQYLKNKLTFCLGNNKAITNHVYCLKKEIVQHVSKTLTQSVFIYLLTNDLWLNIASLPAFVVIYQYI